MTLDVVGAGFGRTGTLSLKAALERLGFGPCYHMAEVIKPPPFAEHWLAAAEGRAVDWDVVLTGNHQPCKFFHGAHDLRLAAFADHADLMDRCRTRPRLHARSAAFL